MCRISECLRWAEVRTSLFSLALYSCLLKSTFRANLNSLCRSLARRTLPNVPSGTANVQIVQIPLLLWCRGVCRIILGRFDRWIIQLGRLWCWFGRLWVHLGHFCFLARFSGNHVWTVVQDFNSDQQGVWTWQTQRHEELVLDTLWCWVHSPDSSVGIYLTIIPFDITERI